MRIAVIDGQGGGIGKAFVEKLVRELSGKRLEAEIIALGTNSTATTGMIRAGAHSGATGENAIRVMAKKVDMIIGPIAIVIADSMMGEITLGMTEAISQSEAVKILLPLNRCNLLVAGTRNQKMTELMEAAVEEVLQILENKEICE